METLGSNTIFLYECRHKNNAMRLILFMCAFLFIGCYSEQKAQNDIDKVKEKHPKVLVDYISKNYPCDTIKGKIDTTEKIRWIRVIDSTNKKIVIFRDTLKKVVRDTIFQTNNRCEERVKELTASLSDADAFIEGLQETLNRQVPVVTQYVTIKDTALIQSKNFEIQGLRVDYDKANSKRIDLLWWVIVLLILLGISIILHFIRK